MKGNWRLVLSSYDDEIYILGSVHHVLKVGSHLSSQTKKLQWLTIRIEQQSTYTKPEHKSGISEGL